MPNKHIGTITVYGEQADRQWSGSDWARFHQSEAAWLSEKARNPFFSPKARMAYQASSADNYRLARKHMGLE